MKLSSSVICCGEGWVVAVLTMCHAVCVFLRCFICFFVSLKATIFVFGMLMTAIFCVAQICVSFRSCCSSSGELANRTRSSAYNMPPIHMGWLEFVGFRERPRFLDLRCVRSESIMYEYRMGESLEPSTRPVWMLYVSVGGMFGCSTRHVSLL